MISANSSKRIHILGYALVILQGILILTLGIWFVGNSYTENWENYLSHNQYTFNLNNVPYSQREEISDYLEQYALKDKLLISRVDNSQDKLAVGIAGTAEPDTFSFNYLGQKIIDESDVNNLLKSPKDEASLGLGNGTVNQIKNIYQFPYSKTVVIYKLNYLVKTTDSVDGNYQVRGLKSHKQYEKLLKNLASLVGQSTKELQLSKNGYATEKGTIFDFLCIGIAIVFIMLVCYFVYLLLNEFSNMGTLIMLGWTKQTILWQAFHPFLICGIVVFIALSLISSFLVFPIKFSWAVLPKILFSQLMMLTMVAISFLIASFTILFKNNIDLLKNRFSRKALYCLILALYVVISGIVTAGSLYIDMPAKSIVNNMHQAHQWSKVENYQILQSMTTGTEGDSAYGDTGSKLNYDLYHLYQKIEDKKGVYLINSFYADKQWIENLNNNENRNLPLHPFWQLTLSPNYLEKLHISNINDLVKKAKNGTRVYLIPEKLYSKEYISYLKNDAQDGISKGDISTEFVKKRKFIFKSYKNNQNVFTWNDNPANPTSSKEPVIFLCTSQNMTYVDIGNLMATGFNGNLKFENGKIRKSILTTKLLQAEGLGDNHLKFASVKIYINGLQKELSQTFALFGAVILMSAVLLSMVLLVLISVYQLANKENLAVKRLLGFTKAQLYKMPFMVVTIISVVELLAVIIGKSKLGLLIIPIVYILQMLLLIRLANKNFEESKQE